ncbi:MobV family relaxase [Phaeobacter inhibens]|uniref:MobV family relaxase n=1 Tax=Phaeobacter inhibens TaxID=221822 RepID=UPI0021A2DD1C|nr:MobV family relaxase [Phaeobacter inhibens]UWR88042.1 plasmid recombination protein [Phaeobacter inhibens]
MLEEKSALDEAFYRRITKTKGGGSGGGFHLPQTGTNGDAPGFVILRTAKIKTLGNMSGSLQHTFRERETPNADEARRAQNQVVIGPDNSEAVLLAWKENAPEKVRKNAVIGIEYLVTGSPAAMARMSRSEQDEYFAKSIQWLKIRHGAENILSAVIHRDETTPHLTAMVMPKDARGKLNARQFLGGRHKLREMQSDFAERVGRPHGLMRGIEGSKATHQRVRSYYAALERPSERPVQLPERRKGGFMGRGGESDDDFRQRTAAAVDKALRHSEDRLKALVDGLRRQSAQDLGIMRSLKSERDAARQDIEKYQQMSTTLYAVERLLSMFERQAGAVEQEALATAAQAIEQLKVKPNSAVMADIAKRLEDLGYKERPERGTRPADTVRAEPVRTPRQRDNPDRSR